MHLPPLETARLIIRPYTMADLDAVHELLVAAFASTNTLEDTRDWLTWTIASYRQHARLHQPPYGDYAVTLRETGALVGTVGLVPAVIPWDVLDSDEPPENPPLSPEFGLYWGVHPEHQRQGYATEAGWAMVNTMFTAWHVRRMVATTEHGNTASQGVMRKLGMTLRQNRHEQPPWCQVVGVLDNTWGCEHADHHAGGA
ncbi:GNAT family N-acetyltransferase, partial [Chloroflexota bacterium]